PVSSTLYGSGILTGEVGGSITYQCFYSTTAANRHDRKYWCKIARSGVCYTIISTTGYTSKQHVGRVFLQDSPRNGTVTVTMTQLRSNDTGTYRCGIGTNNRDLFVSLDLSVQADASALGQTELIQGELLGSVTVLCPAGDTRGGEKRFWCKVRRSSCALIADTDGYVGRTYQGRISITPQESSGAFKVLINDLRKEDSGLYRCGTGQPSSRGSPREVALQVTTASTLPKRPKFLSGTVGGSLSIRCHHDPKGSYEKKYLCRWQAASCSLLVDADGFVHKSYEGRIQIVPSDQENGTYTVVMRQLREEDAGWYWCGAKDGHTEHTSSVKLRIQTEIRSSQDPQTSTLVSSTLSSPAPSSTPTQSCITGLTYATGHSSDSSSTLLPTAPPGSFATSPGKIYHESSSGESPLLPAVLTALILLIFITATLLTLTKIKLQKQTRGSSRGNLEAASVRAGLNPGKEQMMEETLSPEKVPEGTTGTGKCRWV
ncbi:PIGR protein, partial [Urocolius indicus]|nr:PIGR protein [Urocolius indicus]